MAELSIVAPRFSQSKSLLEVFGKYFERANKLSESCEFEFAVEFGVAFCSLTQSLGISASLSKRAVVSLSKVSISKRSINRSNSN